ncbi:hypothetical protein J6590_063881 [Homalodisca vitripennis]|nr:hypothetical protein J6590_063881 [Homalodisca vitripennis]
MSLVNSHICDVMKLDSREITSCRSASSRTGNQLYCSTHCAKGTDEKWKENEDTQEGERQGQCERLSTLSHGTRLTGLGHDTRLRSESKFSISFAHMDDAPDRARQTGELGRYHMVPLFHQLYCVCYHLSFISFCQYCVSCSTQTPWSLHA